MTADCSAAREAVAGAVRAAVARKRPRVSQSTIARALGMSQPSLSARFNGRVPFSTDELFAIGKVLNVPLSDLLPVGEDERSCMNSVAMTFTAA